jgi:SAM-dependent methyltransferase
MGSTSHSPRPSYHVSSRTLSSQIKNYRKAMEEVSRCLKPGGVAIFVDFDMELLCNDMVTVLPMAMVDQEVHETEFTDGRSSTGDDTGAKSPTTEGSWLQRVLYGG